MYFGRDGIQPSEAVKLLESGEWVRQEEVIDGAVKRSIQLANARPPGTQDKGDFEPFRKLLTDLRNNSWPFESRFVVEPVSRLDPKVYVRVGVGKILKIGHALRSPITQALGLLLYSATTTNTGGFLYLGFFVMGWPILETLRKAFETIDDPDELLVFEMIATISGELRVVNPAALDRENFTEAYGRCAPYIEDISARLDPKVSACIVKKSLVALRNRNVLVCTEERWRIAF